MKVVTILLVEDDQLDIIDIKRTLDKMKIMYSLHISKNGEEAIAYLQEQETAGHEKLPDFILIDINMPKMNGLELLANIRNNPAWKHLKCFVITTSDEQVDKETAKKLDASGYIIKPFKLTNHSSMDSFNLMIDLMNAKD